MVNIKWIRPIGHWYYSLKQEDCAICRVSLNKPAIGFESQHHHDTLQDFTAVTEGLCGHAYHKICIQKWLNTRQVCPLCNQAWKSSGSG